MPPFQLLNHSAQEKWPARRPHSYGPLPRTNLPGAHQADRPIQPLASCWVHERKSSLWALTQRLSRIQRPLELSWASGGPGSSCKPHPNPRKSVSGCFFTTEEKSPNPDQRETWPACRNLDVPKNSVFKNTELEALLNMYCGYCNSVCPTSIHSDTFCMYSENPRPRVQHCHQ